MHCLLAIIEPLHMVHVLAEEVRQQREKETKNDTTIELAALLHEVRPSSTLQVLSWSATLQWVG